MKINQAEFITSAPTLRQAPETGHLPEFAFVGRSNVGKSSLINSLCQRKKLAQTSNTPGKTRLINFYRLSIGEAKETVMFADLPGYGYAKVSKSEQAHWGPNLEAYLTGRSTLKAVVQVIDSRHGLQVNDLEMLSWLEAQRLPTILVLSKIDKLTRHQVQQQCLDTERRLALAQLSPHAIVPYSAERHEGRDALWYLLRDEYR